MKDDILKIIEKNLPSQTAGVLKEYLDRAELTEQALESEQSKLKKAHQEIAEYKKQEEKLKSLTSWENTLKSMAAGLDTRQFELDARERGMDKDIMTTKMEGMEANMRNMEAMVTKVFGHPAVTVTRQVPVADGDYNAQGQYGGGESLMDTKETTTESKA